jgi:succinyl-CoA synthetase beta subunit
MKTNIVISPSQQNYNKCASGDSESDHCRLIAEKVVEILKKYECNVWLVPKIEGTEAEILSKVVNSSNYFCKSNPSDADFHLDDSLS